MTELRPVDQYHVNTPDGNQQVQPCLDPALVVYYEEKRRALITELRAVDRILGRPQTVPERDRTR